MTLRTLPGNLVTLLYPVSKHAVNVTSQGLLLVIWLSFGSSVYWVICKANLTDHYVRQFHLKYFTN